MNLDEITLPATSKVWIYQSNREFTDAEIESIHHVGNYFLTHWESHGMHINGSVKVHHRLFIVVMADAQGTKLCGSAMDGSVRLIKEIEKELGVVLMDRMRTAYRNERGEIISIPLSEFALLFEKGEITELTIVFNNLVQTKDEFETRWEVPVMQSWHNRMLPVN